MFIVVILVFTEKIYDQHWYFSTYLTDSSPVEVDIQSDETLSLEYSCWPRILSLDGCITDL